MIYALSSNIHLGCYTKNLQGRLLYAKEPLSTQ